MANGLSDKRKQFADEYLKDHNATQAAIRAGYSKKTAKNIASRLLTIASVQEYLAHRAKELLEKAEITPEKVLKELSTIAFSDIRDMVEWNGERVVFKPSAELSDTAAHAISEVSAETATTRVDENIESHVTKMKLKTWNKNQALDKLGQYFKLFTENLNISGKLTIEDLKNMSDSEIDELLGGGE